MCPLWCAPFKVCSLRCAPFKACPLRCAPFKVCPLRCAPFKVCDIFCTVHVHASCACYHTLQTHTHKYTHTHTHTHTHTTLMESYNCKPQCLASSHLLPPPLTTPTRWLHSLVRSPSPCGLEVLGVVVSSVYVVLHTIYGKQTILINHHTTDYEFCSIVGGHESPWQLDIYK